MKWVEEATKRIKIRMLLQKKIESTLQRMEEELKNELKENDIDTSHIIIKYGKDEETCRYKIQIQNKQVCFSLDDIIKNLSASHNREINMENITDDDIYNEVIKIIECPLIKDL